MAERGWARMCIVLAMLIVGILAGHQIGQWTVDGATGFYTARASVRPAYLRDRPIDPPLTPLDTATAEPASSSQSFEARMFDE